jgi:hypothetical protein
MAKQNRPSTGGTNQKIDAGGYFRISKSAVRFIAENCSSLALRAYFILCWGIDNKNHGSSERTTAHSAFSVAKQLNISHATAKAAVDELVEVNEIENVGADHLPLYKLNAERISDLVGIDNRFAVATVGDMSPLVRLCAQCGGTAYGGRYRITQAQAAKDALVTFVALHDSQDFDRFCGVDPNCVSGDFAFVEDMSEAGGREAVMALWPNPAMAVVTVREHGNQIPTMAFARKLMEGATAANCTATPFERATHALTQLRELRFIYTAHVLFDSDPRDHRFEARPIATHYIKGSVLTELETAQHTHVDKFLRDVRMQAWNDQVENRDENLFQYVVPAEAVDDAIMLSIVRVRWWAFDPRNLHGIQVDRFRNENQVKLLNEAW